MFALPPTPSPGLSRSHAVHFLRLGKGVAGGRGEFTRREEYSWKSLPAPPTICALTLLRGQSRGLVPSPFRGRGTPA